MVAFMIVYLLLILFLYWKQPTFLMEVDEKDQPVRRSVGRYLLFALLLFVFLAVMIPFVAPLMPVLPFVLLF